MEFCQRSLTLLMWLLRAVERDFGLSILSAERHLPAAEVAYDAFVHVDDGSVDLPVLLQNTTLRRILSVWDQQTKSFFAHFSLLKNAARQKKLPEYRIKNLILYAMAMARKDFVNIWS